MEHLHQRVENLERLVADLVDRIAQSQQESINSEVTRSAELLRVQAEGIREESESERLSAELAREQEENVRFASEEGREQAEALRRTAEEARAIAEHARGEAVRAREEIAMIRRTLAQLEARLPPAPDEVEQ